MKTLLVSSKSFSTNLWTVNKTKGLNGWARWRMNSAMCIWFRFAFHFLSTKNSVNKRTSGIIAFGFVLISKTFYFFCPFCCSSFAQQNMLLSHYHLWWSLMESVLLISYHFSYIWLGFGLNCRLQNINGWSAAASLPFPVLYNTILARCSNEDIQFRKDHHIK